MEVIAEPRNPSIRRRSKSNLSALLSVSLAGSPWLRRSIRDTKIGAKRAENHDFMRGMPQFVLDSGTRAGVAVSRGLAFGIFVSCMSHCAERR